MRGYIYLVMAMFLPVIAAHASFVGSASIYAPAVITYNNTGSLTRISLNITTGNGTVSIMGPANVSGSTLYSAVAAAKYASSYDGLNFSDYDFRYYINDSGANVSGPSGGAAMSIVAIAALQGKKVPTDFTMTGTISQNGYIGEIGGVIDKTGAASMAGLRFILVPNATGDQLEEGFYLVAQSEYHIPVIQVSNINQAIGYIFNQNTLQGNQTSVNLTVNYNTAGLPEAQLQCSNNCSTVPFTALVAYTMNSTMEQIANLSSGGSGFSGVAGQLSEVLNSSSAIASKNYLYTAADISFINYLNAYYLSSYSTNRTDALYKMGSIAQSCSNLTAPTLTPSNYEYVISAELRQTWGNYTINQQISTYNVSGATTDDVLSALFSAGQAKAWCSAAGLMYNYSFPYSNITYLSNSSSMRALASSRIARASGNPGMYLSTAQSEYRKGNYPVAILDADYAYALSNATSAFGKNASALDNISVQIAQNSTYGAWATEFAKEALFYAYQSRASSNSTKSSDYADQAYSSAYLSRSISTDMMLIYKNMTAVYQTPQQGQGYAALEDTVTQLKQQIDKLVDLLIVLIVIFVIAIGTMIVVVETARKEMAMNGSGRNKGKHGRSNR